MKRQRPDSGKCGWTPLPTESKKQITHLLFNMPMTPEEVAPLIGRPRNPALGVGVRVVTGVLDFFDVHHHAEGVLRAPGALRMPDRHINVIIGIVQSTPWLYLDEIADEPEARCHVKCLPGLCCAMLKRRGHSLQVMRRIARQRDERKRFRYFLAPSKVPMRPPQLVFVHEVGQGERGCRRRRRWGELGAGCDIREFGCN